LLVTSPNLCFYTAWGNSKCIFDTFSRHSTTHFVNQTHLVYLLGLTSLHDGVLEKFTKFLWLLPVVCSKCRPRTRTQAHAPAAVSTFCCSPLQTSISRCLSPSTLLTPVFHTRCCMMLQILWSTGLKTELFGSHRLGAMKSEVISSQARWTRAFSCWKM